MSLLIRGRNAVVERPIILDCDRLGNQLLRNPVSGVAVDPIRFMQDLPPFRRTPRRLHGPPPLSTHGLAGDRRLRIYRSVTSYRTVLRVATGRAHQTQKRQAPSELIERRAPNPLKPAFPG